MNNRRSNQVLIGNIWFCFVLLCCHPITRMTWEGRPCRRRRTCQGSICCHRMLSSMSNIRYPMTTRMSVQRFVFLSLLPLCFFFYFFLSFPEERGRYNTNGLRFDLLFYLFPGYKLPYLLPQFYLRYLYRSPAGPGQSKDGPPEYSWLWIQFLKFSFIAHNGGRSVRNCCWFIPTHEGIVTKRIMIGWRVGVIWSWICVGVF